MTIKKNHLNSLIMENSQNIQSFNFNEKIKNKKSIQIHDLIEK